MGGTVVGKPFRPQPPAFHPLKSMNPALDPILVKLLALHATWGHAGKPFRLCLDLWLEGCQVSGEVCAAKECFQQQPQPFPYIFATLWHSESGTDELNDEGWLCLRDCRTLSGGISGESAWMRLGISRMLGWSVRSVEGFIPHVDW